MLDIKLLRDNPELVKRGIARKNSRADVDAVLALDAEWRERVTLVEELKQQRNSLSAEVGKKMKAGENADDIREKVRGIAEESGRLDIQVADLDARIRDLMLRIPNLPHDSVPDGRDETENRVVREWGTKPQFDFAPRPHWDIATGLGIIDFEQGAKISGSGFIVYRGAGARLQRTLINFMLDLHTAEHGYTEVLPPYLVSRDAMEGTGQYPKFVETDGAYKIEGEETYLIPTAEVPVTNLRRGEILPSGELPLLMVAYTPCFRREAGSYGKETRGITRIHQFDKVELVKLVKPENSFLELDRLVGEVEAVLQRLNLHYRVVEICSGDLGFSNVKQYDLEVWAPGMDAWLEVSSCSNFTDYQSRRAGIRFRREPKAKPEFVHTLNGSGLALPRTMIAVLEQYQVQDGRVRVPDAIRAAFGREEIGQTLEGVR